MTANKQHTIKVGFSEAKVLEIPELCAEPLIVAADAFKVLGHQSRDASRELRTVCPEELYTVELKEYFGVGRKTITTTTTGLAALVTQRIPAASASLATLLSAVEKQVGTQVEQDEPEESELSEVEELELQLVHLKEELDDSRSGWDDALDKYDQQVAKVNELRELLNARDERIEWLEGQLDFYQTSSTLDQFGASRGGALEALRNLNSGAVHLSKEYKLKGAKPNDESAMHALIQLGLIEDVNDFDAMLQDEGWMWRDLVDRNRLQPTDSSIKDGIFTMREWVQDGKVLRRYPVVTKNGLIAMANAAARRNFSDEVTEEDLIPVPSHLYFEKGELTRMAFRRHLSDAGLDDVLDEKVLPKLRELKVQAQPKLSSWRRKLQAMSDAAAAS